jgi:hypothetical protein
MLGSERDVLLDDVSRKKIIFIDDS